MSFKPYQPFESVIYRIYYFGKSNKDFTHGKVYKYFGSFINTPTNKSNGTYSVSITIYGNRGNMISFNDEHFHYVDSNFKLMTIDEYNQYIRKNKLKKISSNCSSFPIKFESTSLRILCGST